MDTIKVTIPLLGFDVEMGKRLLYHNPVILFMWSIM